MKICGPDGLHDLRLSSMTEQWTESGSKYLRSVRLSSSRDRQTNRRIWIKWPSPQNNVHYRRVTMIHYLLIAQPVFCRFVVAHR